jgi:hypothetical protein
MDWRPHNPRVGEYAAEVIRLFKPDLVHIHCLQRLGQAPARKAEPTVLVGEEAVVGQPPRVVQGDEVGERLRTALGKARALLSVSEPFADLFRSCGFEARARCAKAFARRAASSR